MNKMKISLLVLLVANFTPMTACSSEENPTDNDEQDAGYDAGEDTGNDTGDDVGDDAEANSENGEELKENGEPCSCGGDMPGSSTRCDDECKGEWCYSPSDLGEEPYCTEQCNTNPDCEEDGWYCSSLGCVDEDRV